MNDNYLVPPQNIDAERAVLGAMLLPNNNTVTISKVLKIITIEEMFYKEAHVKIFSAIRDMFVFNIPVDLITLTEKLLKLDSLEKVGDVSYLDEMIDSVPTAENVGYYASIVKDEYIKRKVLAVSARIKLDIYDPSCDLESMSILLEETQKLLSNSDVTTTKIKDLISTYLSSMDEKSEFTDSIPTGISSYDNIILGYCRGTYNTIASRPGKGKSMLAVNMAINMAKNGYKVCIYSLEMSKKEIILRMLANQSNIPMFKIRTSNLSETDYKKIVIGASSLYRLSIDVNDVCYKLTDIITDIASKSEEEKFDIVFIDYIQLMHSSQKFKDRNTELTEISNRIKQMARRFQIPVVVLSQLSRDIERRVDHRPKLSDLRDSGSLEQDSDIVTFIHHPFEYDKTVSESIYELIVEKHRQGPTGIATVSCRQDTMYFGNYTGNHNG